MQINQQLIRDTRQQRGWTQQQLAELCGLSLRTIQRVELQGTASLETCQALASVLELDRQTLQQMTTTGAVPLPLLLLTLLCGLLLGALLGVFVLAPWWG